MAFVFSRDDNVYVVYGETVILANSSQELTELTNPELREAVPEEKDEAKEEPQSSDPECEEKDEEKVEKCKDTDNGDGEKDTSKAEDSKKKPVVQDRSIICCCLSTSGSLLAVADHAKCLIVWSRESPDKAWYIASNRTTKRKCIKLVFCESSQAILAADRAGDVYSFSMSQPLEPEKLLLGHLSMLLDMVVSHDGKFIITSDRDEKIRVSRYPNTYNIQSYCLGHTEFVSSLSLYTNKADWLLSGSGDGTIRVWNYMTGKQLCSHSYTSDLQAFLEKGNNGEPFKKIPAVSEIQVSKESGLLAVLFDKVAGIGLLQLDAGTEDPKLSHKQFVTFTAEPWDIEINDNSNQLFVLCPNEEEMLTVLVYTREKPESNITFQTLRNSETDSSVDKLKTLLKSRWDSMKVCKKRDDFQHLYKQWFDNMKVYLEKKELREQEKLNKSKKKKFKK